MIITIITNKQVGRENNNNNNNNKLGGRIISQQQHFLTNTRILREKKELKLHPPLILSVTPENNGTVVSKRDCSLCRVIYVLLFSNSC